MCRACAGSTSAMCSGSSQADDIRKTPGVKTEIVPACLMASGQKEPQHHEAREHAAEADETNLPIAHLQCALEHAAPLRRADEGQRTFDHQHQREGTKQ